MGKPFFSGEGDALEFGCDADAPAAGKDEDLGLRELSVDPTDACSILSSSLLHAIEKS